ncbi:MAG TPA: 30S ribosomal protein S6 [Chitinophagales bacterium]|nr:30S ribosomal protein S6 [Chitinophagales bacterium]
MNNYETVFISTPILSTEEYARTVKKFTDFIESNEGVIVQKEDWGLKQLAYPIQKKTTGYYTLIDFKIAPEVIRRLEIEFKRDENVMRFLTVKQNKHAVKYAQQRRDKLAGKTQKQEG